MFEFCASKTISSHSFRVTFNNWIFNVLNSTSHKQFESLWVILKDSTAGLQTFVIFLCSTKIKFSIFVSCIHKYHKKKLLLYFLSNPFNKNLSPFNRIRNLTFQLLLALSSQKEQTRLYEREMAELWYHFFLPEPIEMKLQKSTHHNAYVKG